MSATDFNNGLAAWAAVGSTVATFLAIIVTIWLARRSKGQTPPPTSPPAKRRRHRHLTTDGTWTVIKDGVKVTFTGRIDFKDQLALLARVVAKALGFDPARRTWPTATLHHVATLKAFSAALKDQTRVATDREVALLEPTCPRPRARAPRLTHALHRFLRIADFRAAGDRAPDSGAGGRPYTALIGTSGYARLREVHAAAALATGVVAEGTASAGTRDGKVIVVARVAGDDGRVNPAAVIGRLYDALRVLWWQIVDTSAATNRLAVA